MKVKNQILVLALLLVGTFSFAQESNINLEASKISWLGKKIGGQHDGNISLQSGTLTIENNAIVDGSFVIDMNTMTCNDIKNEEYNQNLIGHLKSDDFFGVEKFPTASFSITEATAFNNNEATVKGKMTIKGITNPIQFVVVKNGDVYTAKVEVDRSKFDVRYGSTSFFDNLKDKAIDDIFTLDIDLVLK